MPLPKIVGNEKDIDKLNLEMGEFWGFPEDFFPVEPDPETATEKEHQAYVKEVDAANDRADALVAEVNKRFASKQKLLAADKIIPLMPSADHIRRHFVGQEAHEFGKKLGLPKVKTEKAMAQAIYDFYHPE